MKCEANSQATAACTPPFPARTDVHWETAHLQVWNPQEGATERHELVYEVSWVNELRMVEIR
jgi:hypothetical protein